MNALNQAFETRETYSGCVTRRPNKLILHCFPAFATDLQGFQEDELDKLAQRIVTQDKFRKRVRTIWIDGHAASWKNTANWKYKRNSRRRAVATRSYLQRKLRDLGLSYRVSIKTTAMADLFPLVPNHKESTSREARRNREINRRVEILINWE